VPVDGGTEPLESSHDASAPGPTALVDADVRPGVVDGQDPAEAGRSARVVRWVVEELDRRIPGAVDLEVLAK